jgi:predicted DNA-binding transcriptional regulator AlpA
MSTLINLRQVMEIFGVRSRSTIYRWVEDGKIPKPVKTWGSPRWKAKEIESALGDNVIILGRSKESDG